jgi:hypothetical protein
VVGVTILLPGNGEHFSPAVDHRSRLSEAGAIVQDPVELWEVAGGDTGKHVVVDVVIEAPVNQLDQVAHLDGSRAQALVVDVVEATDVFGLMPQHLESRRRSSTRKDAAVADEHGPHALPTRLARTLALHQNALDSFDVVSWMASVLASHSCFLCK